jgi:PKD repeat protein
MIGSCSSLSYITRGGDHQNPPYNPLRVNFTYNPNPGYYGETVTFYGSCTGGTTPYSWDWLFPGNIHYYTRNCTHTFNPTSSPSYYTVRLTVTDSSSPPGGPFTNYKEKSVQIKIEFNLRPTVDLDSPLRIYPRYGTVGVICTVFNEYQHICPEWSAYIKITNLADEEQYRSEPPQTGRDLGAYEETEKWTDYWYNAESGWHKAWVIVEDSPYDQNNDNNDEWIIFYVQYF